MQAHRFWLVAVAHQYRTYAVSYHQRQLQLLEPDRLSVAPSGWHAHLISQPVRLVAIRQELLLTPPSLKKRQNGFDRVVSWSCAPVGNIFTLKNSTITIYLPVRISEARFVESGKTLIFLINNFELPHLTIEGLYKTRTAGESHYASNRSSNGT